MEDDLNFFVNGRRPQFFGKWKKTSIFFVNGRQSQHFVNGRRPQFIVNISQSQFCKLKTTFSSSLNARQLYFL